MFGSTERLRILIIYLVHKRMGEISTIYGSQEEQFKKKINLIYYFIVLTLGAHLMPSKWCTLKDGLTMGMGFQ
jgi:hypothetical protein